jgi:hypothetical protein
MDRRVRFLLVGVFGGVVAAAQSSATQTPDLSGLKAEERQSIESACSGAKYVEGPAAYNQCPGRQICPA